jgi:hypothetical protein
MHFSFKFIFLVLLLFIFAYGLFVFFVFYLCVDQILGGVQPHSLQLFCFLVVFLFFLLYLHFVCVYIVLSEVLKYFVATIIVCKSWIIKFMFY